MTTKKLTFLQALKAARPLIARGSTSFICFALADVGGGHYQARITKQLGNHATYTSWVQENHPDTYETMIHKACSFKQGRLQWIDHMIALEQAK